MAKVTVYDKHVEFYVAFVDRVRDTPPVQITLEAIFNELGEIRGLNICDLAC